MTYDPALARACWVVKVATICRSSKYAGHGRDVETEQSSADGSEATDGVDAVEGLHAVGLSSLGVELGQLRRGDSGRVGAAKGCLIEGRGSDLRVTGLFTPAVFVYLPSRHPCKEGLRLVTILEPTSTFTYYWLA